VFGPGTWVTDQTGHIGNTFVEPLDKEYRCSWLGKRPVWRRRE
jgi:hypothetical protein